MPDPAAKSTGMRYAAPPKPSKTPPARELIRCIQDYAREYIRLSLLGVNNINQLVECTKALPPAIRGNNYRAKDQDLVDKWVQTKEKIKLFGETLESGDLVSGFTDLIAKALKGLKLFSW